MIQRGIHTVILPVCVSKYAEWYLWSGAVTMMSFGRRLPSAIRNAWTRLGYNASGDHDRLRLTYAV